MVALGRETQTKIKDWLYDVNVLIYDSTLNPKEVNKMRTEFVLCKDGTSQTFGTFSTKGEAFKARKKKDEALYVCEKHVPISPAELAQELDVDFTYIEGFKPYSNEAIIQNNNAQAFEDINAALSDVCTQAFEQEEELQKLRESEKELREGIRGLLLWLLDENLKTQVEDEKKAEEARVKFFDVLGEEIDANCREYGFYTRGRIDLSGGD